MAILRSLRISTWGSSRRKKEIFVFYTGGIQKYFFAFILMLQFGIWYVKLLLRRVPTWLFVILSIFQDVYDLFEGFSPRLEPSKIRIKLLSISAIATVVFNGATNVSFFQRYYLCYNLDHWCVSDGFWVIAILYGRVVQNIGLIKSLRYHHYIWFTHLGWYHVYESFIALYPQFGIEDFH